MSRAPSFGFDSKPLRLGRAAIPGATYSRIPGGWTIRFGKRGSGWWQAIIADDGQIVAQASGRTTKDVERALQPISVSAHSPDRQAAS